MTQQLTVPNSKCLPPEIWETIFDYIPSKQLPKLRQVCRHWRDIVANCPTLAEKLSFYFPQNVTVNRKFKPKQFPPMAKNVCFKNVKIVDVPAWWSSMGPNLTNLEVSFSDVSMPTLLEMLRFAVNLKRLKLLRVSFKNVVRETVNFKLDKLERLSLNSVVEANVLTVFGQICPNLKDFYVFMVTNHPDYDADCVIQFVQTVQSTLERLELNTTKNFLAELSSFEELTLKQFVFNWKDEREEELVRFCRTQPSIEQLRIAQVALTNSALYEIGRSLPNLKLLSTQIKSDVSFLDATPKLEYLSLSSHYSEVNLSCCQNPNLTELYLGYITPIQDSLSKYLSGCPNLRRLNLQKVTISSWTELFTAIKPLKSLQFLALTRLELQTQTLDCPIPPMENLLNLTLIQFQMPEPVMAALFRALLNSPDSGQLRLLELNGWPVSEEVALEFARNNVGREWRTMSLGRGREEVAADADGLDSGESVENEHEVENSDVFSRIKATFGRFFNNFR